MSAFSGRSRKGNDVSPNIIRGHPPPGRTMFEAQGFHYTQNPLQHPIQAFNYAQSPLQHPMQASSYNRSPILHQRQASQPLYMPNINFQRSSANFARGNNFTSPGFGRGTPCVSSGRGRGVLAYNYIPHYNSGRGQGRGRSFGNRSSPGSGPSVKRGTGSHNSVSADVRPDLYYQKEMVEDPWKNLIPVMWKGI